MDKHSDTERLIALAAAGDKSAANTLVEENTGLIRCVVKRFLGRGYEAEDLFQVGAIGLIKAIQKFDLSYQVKFSTYAVPMIMGEIKRYIRDDGIIKVSRSIKELSAKAAIAREELMRETGEEPSISDVAQKVGVTAEEIALAFDATARPESIYAAVDDGNHEGQALIDRIESPENCENNIVNKILLSTAIKEFPKREQKIIMLRYFRQKTQSQIAEIMGISQVQVSRIEKRILEKLRTKIAEN